MRKLITILYVLIVAVCFCYGSGYYYGCGNDTSLQPTGTEEGDDDDDSSAGETIDYGSVFDGDCGNSLNDDDNANFDYGTLSMFIESLGLDWDIGCIAEETYERSEEDKESGCISVTSLCTIQSEGKCRVSDLNCRADDDGGYVIADAEGCYDSTDDDGDGLVSCADPDCLTAPICGDEDSYSGCQDGYDNDGDGNTDCNDSNCNARIECILETGGGELIASDIGDAGEDLLVNGNYAYAMVITGPAKIVRINVSTGAKTTLVEDDSIRIGTWCIDDNGLYYTMDTGGDAQVHFIDHDNTTDQNIFTDKDIIDCQVAGDGTVYLADASKIYEVVYSGGSPDSLSASFSGSTSIDKFVIDEILNQFIILNNTGDWWDGTYEVRTNAIGSNVITDVALDAPNLNEYRLFNHGAKDDIYWVNSERDGGRGLYKYDLNTNTISQHGSLGGGDVGMYGEVIYYAGGNNEEGGAYEGGVYKVVNENNAGEDELVITDRGGGASFGFDPDNDKLYFLVGNEDLETYNLYRMNVP